VREGWFTGWGLWLVGLGWDAEMKLTVMMGETTF
jgi:hypothetical protein